MGDLFSSGYVNNEYTGRGIKQHIITQFFTDFLKTHHNHWRGSATSLLKHLSTHKLATVPEWPSTPLEVVKWLQRMRPALHKTGVYVQFSRWCGNRIIILTA
jgi:hypothetical protein